MKRQLYALWRYVLFSLALFAGTQAFAQSISRQSINSSGGHQQIEELYIRQTVGQPYQTNTRLEEDFAFRPGFQQPTTFRLRLSEVKSIPDMQIDVYPNPATTSLLLRSSASIENAFLKIMDIRGNVVFNQEIDSFRNHEISCVDWQGGIYFLSLTTPSQQKYTSKLLITK